MGSSLQGNFVIWREKIKKYIREAKGNLSTLEGNLPCWREILHSLQGNKTFFPGLLYSNNHEAYQRQTNKPFHAPKPGLDPATLGLKDERASA